MPKDYLNFVNTNGSNFEKLLIQGKDTIRNI